MRSRQITLIALAFILLFGVLLRLYKLDFGVELPYVAHTDEPTQYNPAIRILTTGDLNPHFFNYPSLPIYLYSAVLAFRGDGLQVYVVFLTERALEFAKAVRER